jgi:hypothetical protein
LLLERVIPTSAAAVLELIELLRGNLHVAFEEGASSEWLVRLLQPRVAQVLVCDPRKNDRRGSKNDRIDAGELSDLLRCGRLSAVLTLGTETMRGLDKDDQQRHKNWDVCRHPHEHRSDTAENPSSEKVRLGAGCRVNPPPPVVGEIFLLTSPFTESPDLS